MEDTKVLLYSGGMDSFLINKLWQPDILLYVNMHTRYSKQEMERLPNNVLVVDLDLGLWERPDAIIPLRNLYLVMVASNYGNRICLGATAGDRVLDKSHAFAAKASSLLSYLYSPQHWIPEGQKIEIDLSFKDHTKTDLIRMYVAEGGNLEYAFNHSFSCYDPIGYQPCWNCKPCFRKFVAFYINGFQFEDNVCIKVKRYMTNNIVPDILKGLYGRKEEETEIMEVYNDLCLRYPAH